MQAEASPDCRFCSASMGRNLGNPALLWQWHLLVVPTFGGTEGLSGSAVC